MSKEVNETAKVWRVDTIYNDISKAEPGLNQHWYPWGPTNNNTG